MTVVRITKRVFNPKGLLILCGILSSIIAIIVESHFLGRFAYKHDWMISTPQDVTAYLGIDMSWWDYTLEGFIYSIISSNIYQLWSLSITD